VTNLLAERRLADVQPNSCASEIQFFGYSYQVSQVTKFHWWTWYAAGPHSATPTALILRNSYRKVLD